MSSLANEACLGQEAVLYHILVHHNNHLIELCRADERLVEHTTQLVVARAIQVVDVQEVGRLSIQLECLHFGGVRFTAALGASLHEIHLFHEQLLILLCDRENSLFNLPDLPL